MAQVESEAGPSNSSLEEDSASQIRALYLEPRTAKARLMAKVLSKPDTRHQPYCDHLRLQDCARASATQQACQDIHFEQVLHPQTDPEYGHCSYLNTCHRSATCKYLHFRPARSRDASPFVWRSKHAEPCPPLVANVAVLGSPSALARLQPLPLLEGEIPSMPEELDEEEALSRALFETAPVRHPLMSILKAGAPEWCGGREGFEARSAKRVDRDGLPPSACSGPNGQVPAQWMDVDLRTFDYGMLGKVDVILADPPWDIHMSLPYGTMSDDQMRSMPFPQLQDEGFIFLWVTGRAMELGRELLSIWGYSRLDELIWVKVGQTQRLIRTGRTGHWLNHTKEHCLVGVKLAQGTPPLANPLPNLTTVYPAAHAAGVPAPLPRWAHGAGLSSDVIVSEVRDTSRKPDELYGLIERLCPGGRKVELFGRPHNARPGWITLGNQLKSDNVDPVLEQRLQEWRMSELNEGRAIPHHALERYGLA